MAKRSTQPAVDAKPAAADLKGLLSDTKASADSETLLTEILEAWGGARNLARDLHSEFHEAGAGSMTRQRILEMIQRLIVNNTKDDLARSFKPSDLADDDLELHAMRLLSKGLGNGPATTTPAAGKAEA